MGVAGVRPRGAPHAVQGAPRRAPGDASEASENPFCFKSLSASFV